MRPLALSASNVRFEWFVGNPEISPKRHSGKLQSLNRDPKAGSLAAEVTLAALNLTQMSSRGASGGHSVP